MFSAHFHINERPNKVRPGAELSPVKVGRASWYARPLQTENNRDDSMRGSDKDKMPDALSEVGEHGRCRIRSSAATFSTHRNRDRRQTRIPSPLDKLIRDLRSAVGCVACQRSDEMAQLRKVDAANPAARPTCNPGLRDWRPQWIPTFTGESPGRTQTPNKVGRLALRRRPSVKNGTTRQLRPSRTCPLNRRCVVRAESDRITRHRFRAGL